MGDVFLCKEVESPKKNLRESKESDKDDEDPDLIFVGVEHVHKDAEILFVGMISNSKPVVSNILNRVTPGSNSRRRKGHFRQDPAHVWQPANHVTSMAKAIRPVFPSEGRSTDSPVTTMSSPESAYKMGSPHVVSPNSSDSLPPGTQHLVGAMFSGGGRSESSPDSKRLSTSDINSRNSKRVKLRDEIPGVHSLAVVPSDSSSIISTNTPSQGVCNSSNHVQNGATFPWADANGTAHFNLRNPERANGSDGLVITDISSLASQKKTFDPRKENPIVLLSDFYYGQHKGDGQPEQKTHTTFKCLSCVKVLKNIKFMNHMKHHLEFEKQRNDSWENHTTCQHCHRQFPTPFQLQCHIDSVHIAMGPSAVCKICELSFETDQVLLQHMKDHHKPGEMPYVCQVCHYRSSVFADVETHFRTCHENTKYLLCLFCLKLFKTAIPYMNHCWRHSRRRVLRCSKCRLQFLTLKEEIEHKTKNHQTFKKPEQLQGLPRETKVIIQASAQPGSSGVASIIVSDTDPPPSPVKTKTMATNTGDSRLPCSKDSR
ncbi:zinc finger protein 280A [Macaca thibetana thibetana]|uniref:zinc finger protein 280A n=1 Tax=Macaca thibetana thibetana TaxID=257877 RepID=UPI0021BC662D|nr:zinc finger protein 280A [Macaca thibetana thibetana]